MPTSDVVMEDNKLAMASQRPTPRDKEESGQETNFQKTEGKEDFITSN